jgi:hypothetical protein
MSAIFDQIKSNAVPENVMRTAAKGALPVPPGETLEILVYLTRNPVFGQDAKMTLAGWEIASAVKVLSDPGAPPEVLGYFWMDANRRPSLMPALIENPAITESMLIELAVTAPREMVSPLLASPRVRRSQALTEALAANPELTPREVQSLQEIRVAVPEAAAESDAESEAAHQAWQQNHAAEIAAEEGKPFELIGLDEAESQEPVQAKPAAGGAVAAAPAQPSAMSGASSALAAAALSAHAKARPADEKQLSVLQKIARMKAAERVKAAFSGGREERLILIRDGAKVVQNAVLASPKLTEPEVESFAAAKNVSENVLREIARNRRFMKNYNVGRNLVNNAKCPLDLSLTLVKNLMVYDLKGLRFNKAVPETIRQVAAKLYREKTGPAREGPRK